MTAYALPSPEPSCSERWGSPAYAEEMRAFVEDAVGACALEQDLLRAWSTVWRVRAKGGRRLWAKENCPGAGAEGAVLLTLNALVPQRVVPLTAVDLEPCRLLTPHQGDVLGVGVAGDVDLASWERVVREWALLQRELLAHDEALRGAGVPALPVSDCEELLVTRAEAMHARSAEDPMHLTAEPFARIRAGLAAVREAVEVVGALGLPLALNHNDLHGGNAFAPAEEPAEEDDGPLRFFDLGDAMLTDPLGVLMVPLGGLHDAIGGPLDDPRLWRVADAFVEVWSDLAPAAELRAALPHALRLARIPRHDSWLRITPAMTAREAEEMGRPASAWLAAVPDPPLLAS